MGSTNMKSINEIILVYVEFGTSSTDMITLTNTWAAGGLATAKSYNILARQIPCGANYK